MNRKSRSSKSRRQDPQFARNEYRGENRYDIASLRMSNVDDLSLDILSCKNIKENDIANVHKAVSFFSDDVDIVKFYNRFDLYVHRLAQYLHVFTPDFSLLTDMPIWMQLSNVAKSRWCGRKWQDLGLSVIPTVSWSTKESYDFAFLGLAVGTAVAVSTLSVRSNSDTRILFLEGYNKMMERVQPRTIYCYDKPFPEMKGNVVYLDYLKATGRAR